MSSILSWSCGKPSSKPDMIATNRLFGSCNAGRSKIDLFKSKLVSDETFGVVMCSAKTKFSTKKIPLMSARPRQPIIAPVTNWPIISVLGVLSLSLILPLESSKMQVSSSEQKLTGFRLPNVPVISFKMLGLFFMSLKSVPINTVSVFWRISRMFAMNVACLGKVRYAVNYTIGFKASSLW